MTVLLIVDIQIQNIPITSVSVTALTKVFTGCNEVASCILRRHQRHAESGHGNVTERCSFIVKGSTVLKEWKLHISY
jgi:hypothetical protein